jgi:hypothetical protein
MELMARCDQGYLCEVCGEEVAEIVDSDLYLRFVLGELPPRALLTTPDRHLRCNPVLSQFIVDEQFTPVEVLGPFDKRQLDPDDVRRQEALVTRGWRRLQQLPGSGLPFVEYPLPEFRETASAVADGSAEVDSRDSADNIPRGESGGPP